MDFEQATVEQKTSFIYFVYPFLFPTSDFEARVATIASATIPEPDLPLPIWEPQKFPEDDLLFHVANYLNPKDNANSTTRLWKLSEAVRDNFGFRRGKTNWQLSSSQGKIPFTFGEGDGEGSKVVQLVLFKIGVGFLIVRSQPLSDRVNDWLNFIHYFRFTSKRQNVRIQALQQQRDRQLNQTQEQPFFPNLAGGIEVHPDGAGELSEILRALLYTAAFPQEARIIEQKIVGFLDLASFLPNFLVQTTFLLFRLRRIKSKKPKFIEKLIKINLSITKLFYRELRLFLRELPSWWQEVFVPGQMLPFASIFVNGVSQDNISHLLYKLQNFFPAGELGDNPAPADLQIDSSTRICYGKQQWFTFSLEGASFLAIDVPKVPKTKFYQQNLPVHLRDRYFLLFLIALHQRFTLMMLSAKVADNWFIGNDVKKIDEKRQKIFEEIRNELLLFTARGYYTQVMQREQHHRCYQKWHEVFGLERLYQEVSDEVREMHEYSLMRQTRRLERTIQIIGVAAGTGGIVASSTSAYIKEPLTLNLTGKLDTIHPGVLALLLSLLLGVVAGGLTWLGTGGWNWLLSRIKQFSSKNK